MKFKNNVLDKLVQLEALTNRIQLQVNRAVSQDEILESVDNLKEGIESIREIVSLENDNFESQFNRQ